MIVLQPDATLTVPADLIGASRHPFAGSVGYAVEFATVAGSSAPAWPLLHVGFFGGCTLGRYQESRIRFFHQELMKVLSTP